MKSNENSLLKTMHQNISNVLKRKVVDETIIDKLLKQIFDRNEKDEQV